MITFKPLRCRSIRLQRFPHISNLDLIDLRQILLLGRRASEVPLRSIMLDGHLQTSGRIQWVCLPISFVGLLQSVGGVIRLVEVLCLDTRGFLERLSGFFARFLEPEGVACLIVEVGCVFVLLRFAAKQGEATTGCRERFIGLG